MIEVAKIPELTDEQIDTAWKRANTTLLTEHGPVLNRGLPSWRELRAAFPKPTPPPPKWESGALVVTVATAHEHLIPRDLVGVWVEHGTYGLMPPATARDMAAALIEAADWIEANR